MSQKLNFQFGNTHDRDIEEEYFLTTELFFSFISLN